MKKHFIIFLKLILILATFISCSNQPLSNIPKDTMNENKNSQSTETSPLKTDKNSNYLLVQTTTYNKNNEVTQTNIYEYDPEGKKLSQTNTFYYAKSVIEDLQSFGVSVSPIISKEVITFSYKNNKITNSTIFTSAGDKQPTLYLEGTCNYLPDGSKKFEITYRNLKGEIEEKIGFKHNWQMIYHSTFSNGNLILSNNYFYDDNDFLISETDIKNNKIQYRHEFNEKGFKIKTYEYSGSKLLSVQEFIYDSFGNITEEKKYDKNYELESTKKNEYIKKKISNNNNDSTQNQSGDNELLATITNKLEGIWINIAKSEKYYLDNIENYSFEFLKFEKGSHRYGVYPGSYSRTEYITNVIDKGNNTYLITFKCPAGEYFDEYFEEEIYDSTIKLDNKILTFNGDDAKWEYMGADLDEAISNVAKYHNGIDYQEKKQSNSDNVDGEIDKILKNEKTFIDFQTQKSVSISTLPRVNENYMGTAGRYTIIDLDKDGKDELLVEYNTNGDTAIIKYYKSNWTAFYVPFRAITLLKTDGTMFESNSAYESYVQCIFFSSNGLEFKKIIESNDNTNTYIVNEKNVSKDECQKELKNFFEKELVVWLDF